MGYTGLGADPDVVLKISGNNDQICDIFGCYNPSASGGDSIEETLRQLIASGEGKSDVGPVDPAAGYRPAGAPPQSSISDWLKKNSTAVYAGAGVLVLMAMFGGKRR